MPLRARDLDLHVGGGDRQLFGEQLERGNGDDDQNQHRQHRPQHLDHGVVRRLGRNRIGLVVEFPNDVGQQRQHEQADDGDDRHQPKIVEILDIARDFRHRRLKADLAGNRGADGFGRGHADSGQTGQSPTSHAESAQIHSFLSPGAPATAKTPLDAQVPTPRATPRKRSPCENHKAPSVSRRRASAGR